MTVAQAIVGVAGHVDHGKTALVEALSGQQVARQHERQLGMTQDLGFTYCHDGQGRSIGIIDVPGHERYIRNMVAGAWHLDLTLLVVAADEGWMPMTANHLDVVHAMGCRRYVVCISKSDLANAAQLALLEEDLLERVMDVTGEVPEVITTSAVTGHNIAALQQLLFEQTNDDSAAVSAASDALGYYVDRSFSVNGVGTVVTGTLGTGQLAVGNKVYLQPGNRLAKVRSLQAYRQSVNSVQSGCRVAIGLKGVHRRDVVRGCRLTNEPQADLGCYELILKLTDSKPLQTKRAFEVEVALGTWHGLAHFVYVRGERMARLTFKQPVSVQFGQRLALIRHGGSELVHSAQVAWHQPIVTHYRKPLYQLLAKQPLPLVAPQYPLLKLQLFGCIEAAEIPPQLAPSSILIEGNYAFMPQWLEQTSKLLLELLTPAGRALSSQELASRLRLDLGVVATVMQQLKSQQLVRLSRDLWVKGGGHSEDELVDSERSLLSQARQLGKQGLELAKLTSSSDKQGIRNLARLKYVVVLDKSIIYDAELYQQLIKSIVSDREVGSLVSMAEIKESAGLSRKYAIPLVNKMEVDGWVRRNQNDRVVLRSWQQH
ncbi:SelB C-terminal domain-containing protein [Ferrimonas lipolytica]|uniref:GTP-binding protein n=1 Tax=Ferrimonas lipolytica TaxID=2724191 RepID=A0A6H1UDF6_9GAMM|nr:SelB C-terminal domain-containing protein [Ferrimonas lipolytica]QIZ76246.1 GTP-binding protein [Ferrimonas lipolytica]